MTNIGLIYGSETGFTELVAGLIAEEFNAVAPGLLAVHDIADTPLERMHDYDYLIIGCPTWNIGELQDDWDAVYEKLESLDLSGKKIAIFGLGDQYGYPDSFCDAIGILGRKFIERGATLVGYTAPDRFDFTHSEGVEDGRFMGLALDDENESQQTPEHIADWVWQLVDEFDLVHLLDPVA